MRRAVLVSYLPTHFVELRRVARLLADSGRWEPVFQFARPYPESGADAAVCASEGWRIEGEISRDATSAALAPVPSMRARVYSGLSRVLGPADVLVRWPWRTFAKRRSVARLDAVAQELFRRVGASLVVLSEDNVDYQTPVLIRAAHTLGIPSVIVPFTVANAIEPAEAYADSREHHAGPFDKWVLRDHPEWFFEHRGRTLIRLPAPDARVMIGLGIAPSRPWIVNSGYADAIAVESDAMLEHYRACGIPAAQLVETGALYDDALASAMKDASRMRAELGLDGRRVILCAIPPDQIASRTPEHCDFTSHEELLRFWISVLAEAPGFQIVASLHPRVPASRASFLTGLGVRIAAHDITRLVPLCDLFVASVSATIRLAIASGKPVVNHDLYRYRYTDYANVPGVMTMESRDEFRQTVRRLCGEPGALEDAAKKMEPASARWGRLDGHAGERMLALFERVSSRKAP